MYDPELGSSFIRFVSLCSGKITYYTHPPEQHTLPSHLDASIVQQLGQEFSVASLEKEDEKLLKGGTSHKYHVMESCVYIFFPFLKSFAIQGEYFNDASI